MEGNWSSCETTSNLVSHQISEATGDDLGSAVVAVLAHLGDKDSRSATFTFSEGLDLLRHDLNVGRVPVFGPGVQMRELR